MTAQIIQFIPRPIPKRELFDPWAFNAALVSAFFGQPPWTWPDTSQANSFHGMDKEPA